jgi:hypothetical protein
MLARKGMRIVGQVALAVLAVPSALLICAAALIFTLTCAAPLDNLRA